MAPPPEYDKEPKAPDKSAASSNEDTKTLHNLVSDQQTISDNKPVTTAGSAESEDNKHLEALNEENLRALLDEAITYKCPKDREGKSELFKELLEEVEQDDQESEAATVLGWSGNSRGGRTRRGRRPLPHSNSLQDLVAAALEPLPRRPPRAPVSTRTHHGGSLPSGVDRSFLLGEEPVRGAGAEYVATVRCVNPSPLAERRVSASDAHNATEMELLNRRSKPVFPVTYTARATLEIGSGSVCSGRAVTTTTASNQVRTRGSSRGRLHSHSRYHPSPNQHAPRHRPTPNDIRQLSNQEQYDTRSYGGGPNDANIPRGPNVAPTRPIYDMPQIAPYTNNDTSVVFGPPEPRFINQFKMNTKRQFYNRKIVERDKQGHAQNYGRQHGQTNQPIGTNEVMQHYNEEIGKTSKPVFPKNSNRKDYNNPMLHWKDYLEPHGIFPESKTIPGTGRGFPPVTAFNVGTKLQPTGPTYGPPARLYPPQQLPKVKQRNKYDETISYFNPIEFVPKSRDKQTKPNLSFIENSVTIPKRKALSDVAILSYDNNHNKKPSYNIKAKSDSYIKSDVSMECRDSQQKLLESLNRSNKTKVYGTDYMLLDNILNIHSDNSEYSNSSTEVKENHHSTDIKTNPVTGDDFIISNLSGSQQKLLESLNSALDINADNTDHMNETTEIPKQDKQTKFYSNSYPNIKEKLKTYVNEVSDNFMVMKESARTEKSPEYSLNSNSRIGCHDLQQEIIQFPNRSEEEKADQTIETVTSIQVIENNSPNGNEESTVDIEKRSDVIIMNKSGQTDKSSGENILSVDCDNLEVLQYQVEEHICISETVENNLKSSSFVHISSDQTAIKTDVSDASISQLDEENEERFSEVIVVNNSGRYDVGDYIVNVESDNAGMKTKNVDHVKINDKFSNERSMNDMLSEQSISATYNKEQENIHSLNTKDINTESNRIVEKSNNYENLKHNETNLDDKTKTYDLKISNSNINSELALKCSNEIGRLEPILENSTDKTNNSKYKSHSKLSFGNVSGKDTNRNLVNNSQDVKMKKNKQTKISNKQVVSESDDVGIIYADNILTMAEMSVYVMVNSDKQFNVTPDLRCLLYNPIDNINNGGELKVKGAPDNKVNCDGIRPKKKKRSANKKSSVTVKAAEQVDSGIPFSCITTPEVVTSCNTTSSTSQSTIALDPKPRSVIASSFNGVPLTRSNYGSTSSSAIDDKFQKSLDENGNALQPYSSPHTGSGQLKKNRKKKTSKNETVINIDQMDGYQGNKDLNELLRFIESDADNTRGQKLTRMNPKHKDDADDKSAKKRSTERRTKDKESKIKRANSMEELSRTKLEDLTDRPDPALAKNKKERWTDGASSRPAHKTERRSWGDDSVDAYYFSKDEEPPVAAPVVAKEKKKAKASKSADSTPIVGTDGHADVGLELMDFQTVTKKKRPRKRYEDNDRESGGGDLAHGKGGGLSPERRRKSAPPSDKSNDSNDDMDSVHSLPAEPRTAPRVHASYADIARAGSNIPDLIESCNFYADVDPPPEPEEPRPEPERRPRSESSAAEDASGPAYDVENYPALDRKSRRAKGKESPPDGRSGPSRTGSPPDVVADRRPPVILLDEAARPRDMDGVTFGFDVNEQLLNGGSGSGSGSGSELPGVHVRAGLRYVPPVLHPKHDHHLYQIVHYVNSAWEDIIRCGNGKVRYFSE